MKFKSFNKKLNLNKSTIVNLKDVHLDEIKGGAEVPTDTSYFSDWPTGCVTITCYIYSICMYCPE